jgi:hypothetical protein
LISYHTSDNKWLKRLRDWLTPLESAKKTQVWDRTVVEVGQQPEVEYQRALEEAKVAIPLITPVYLADEALSNELKSILAVVGHDLALLWIAVDYSPYESTVLSEYEPANRADMPLKALGIRAGKEMRCIYDQITAKLGRYSTNLPIDRPKISGRKQEVDDLVRLLRQDGNRIVVLTGSSGIGKTIVAEEVANQLLYDFDDGILWIALSELNDPSQVRGEIARKLDSIKPDRVMEENLLDYIKGRKMLVVLDNFESVPAAAPFVADLLNQAPQFKVLITSHDPFPACVSGQQEYELPPLDEHDSVQLMLDLARQFLDQTQLDEHQVETLTMTAKGLAGNPLAIRVSAGDIVDRWTREIPDS